MIPMNKHDSKYFEKFAVFCFVTELDHVLEHPLQNIIQISNPPFSCHRRTGAVEVVCVAPFK